LKVWAYALNKNAFQGFEKFGDRLNRIYAIDSSFSHSGYESTFVLDGVGQASVHIPLLGEFNLSNALAVWATLLTQGLSIADSSDRVSKLQPVVGRMELISFSKHAKVDGLLAIVDYAHTPDALQKTLTALRPIAEQRGGNIWCVFGCGGDRDTGKRSQMGAVAERFADQIVITSDNPRSEDPLQIIRMIREGIQSADSNVQEIPDRAAAIMAAIRHADVHDIVLVAGKGHETTQEIGDKRFDFSDQEHIRLAAGGLV
jgi:UDP-N-acetylmuramoyl-L-alanyl-D-glutamate--2,6-diaminopimelate ligase